MITNFLSQCKFHYSQKDHVYFFIKNYQQIMQVTNNDLEEMTFEQKVKQIILSTTYQPNPWIQPTHKLNDLAYVISLPI